MSIFRSLICSSIILASLSACDAMQPKESKPKTALEKSLRPAKTYYYKETVQVERELLSYGGKYTCREEIVKQPGKKSPKKVVKVDEYPRAINVEHGYFRSLVDRPCYFKDKKTSLKPVHYKAKKSGGTMIGTPLLVCPNAEAVRAGYEDKSSGCKRVSGALVSFEAWD